MQNFFFLVFVFQTQQWKSLKLISAVYYHNSWILNSGGECLFNNAIVRQFRRKFVKKILLLYGDKFKHTILLQHSRERQSKLEIWIAHFTEAFCLSLSLSNIHSIATIASTLHYFCSPKSQGTFTQNTCVQKHLAAMAIS